MDTWGLLANAQVTLEINGVPTTVVVAATARTFVVAALPPNARLRARQQLGVEQSEWSAEAIAEPVQLPPSPPVTSPSIPRCSQHIFASNVAPGSSVTVLHGSIVAASGVADRAGNACMAVTDPPPASYTTQTTTCGVVSPTGHIDVTPPPEISAPVVVEPVFECQTVVAFQQLVPGAVYEIFVTDRAGVESSLGSFAACTPNVVVTVPRRFAPGDAVSAIGGMERERWQCHVRGRSSVPVFVVPPDDRLTPVIAEPVYEGDAVLRVTNQIEGATITLLRRAEMSAAEETIGARPASQHPEVSVGTALAADNIIWVVQALCGQSRASLPVTVRRRPGVIPQPRIRKPVYACAGVILVDAVVPGATVWVRQVPVGLPGPEILLGKVWSSGSSIAVPVAPRPSHGFDVVAVQDVSGQFGGPSSRIAVELREQIPEPRVVGPIRSGDLSVWCEELLPGASVRIFDARATPRLAIGGGIVVDAAASIPVWTIVEDEARIIATQALCREGRPSPEMRAASGLACDGPPVWDPSKWNDGAFHQMNNNCYNYACDLRQDNFAQPGGFSPPDQSRCDVVTAKSLTDGLKVCVHGRCHPCHHQVALVIDPGEDFHWYRQDRDGLWSQKRGDAAAKRSDEAGNPIVSPETADRAGYTDFCGYFCVYKPDLGL